MASATAVKKKHVRFASMAEQKQEDDDNDEQEEEEDTLFDKRKDAGWGPRSALKAAPSRGGGTAARVEVVGAARGGTCGRWMVTLALCASFLGLVNNLHSLPMFSFRFYLFIYCHCSAAFAQHEGDLLSECSQPPGEASRFVDCFLIHSCNWRRRQKVNGRLVAEDLFTAKC